MDNQIKPCSDDSDFLSQSYNEGVERIVGCKNNIEYTVSTKLLEKRQQFWDDLCTSYSRPFLCNIEYNIATLQPCKPLGLVQYWVNTGNLPYKAMVEETRNTESDMSFVEGQYSNSSLLEDVKETPNEYHGRLISDESSLNSSIDTAAYILSNTNKTNKVKTMAIVEGAKHNASLNQKNRGNVGTAQFENAMLDNNGNGCQAALPTTSSKPTENLTQQITDNLPKSITTAPTDPVNTDSTLNCNSEHHGDLFNAQVARAFNASRYRSPVIGRKCLDAMYAWQKSMADESCTLEDDTSKLSSRKKLYSGRDSPVDLADMTSCKKHVPTKSTKYLHPALHPACKVSKKYTLYRKRKRSRFSIFDKYMLNSSIMSISSHRKRKRRKVARNHASENSSIMDASKKRRIPVAHKTASNPTTNQSFAGSPSSKELLSTKCKLDNSVAQVEKSVSQFSEKSNHASRTYLNPRIYLRPITERDIQKYRSSSNKTVSPVRGLCPVVRLIQLSDADIEKYRKPNREAARPGSLSPTVHLEEPSEFNIRKKSQDALLNGRFRHPVVRLKKLSEQDIKKYKAEIVRSEYSDTAYVPHNSSKCSNISRPGSKAVDLISDSDSDESTVLIYKCKSSASQDRSSLHNISNETRQSSSSIVGASKNRNLVRKDASNVTDSSSNSSCTVERRSPGKNLKTRASNLKTSKSVLPEEVVRQNHEAISCSDKSEIFNKDCRSNGANSSRNARTKRTLYNFLLSDEDDEFVNLIYYPEQRRNSKIRSPYNSPRKNSKIRSPYNSPRKNSDDPVDIRNVGICTTKSMRGQLPSESIGQNTKFEKQTAHIYRKSRSKNLSYLSEEENINRANPVSKAGSSLATRRTSGRKSNESQVVLGDKRKLLTSMNTKRDNSRLHTLRFQTRVFDSDSDSSYFS